MHALQGTGRTGPPLYRSIQMFTVSARHNRLLAIPAALYAVNNSLKFAMQLFFKPTTAKMLGNLKARSPSPFLPTMWLSCRVLERLCLSELLPL